MYWQGYVKKSDSILDKSYPIFGEDSRQFIKRLRSAIITFSFSQENEASHRNNNRTYSDENLEQRGREANEFLDELVDDQNLAKKLKIAFY